MSEIKCAECCKVAPETKGDKWPDGWIGVSGDGVVVYPVGPPFISHPEPMKPAPQNVALCSDKCLQAHRARRQK